MYQSPSVPRRSLIRKSRIYNALMKVTIPFLLVLALLGLTLMACAPAPEAAAEPDNNAAPASNDATE
jgi:hypothetical protein